MRPGDTPSLELKAGPALSVDAEQKWAWAPMCVGSHQKESVLTKGKAASIRSQFH